MHIVSKINWLVALAVPCIVILERSLYAHREQIKINRHCGACCPTCPCIYAVVMEYIWLIQMEFVYRQQ